MDEEKLTLAQALNLAVKKHQDEKLQEAEILYRRILNEYPENPDALHLLGLIAHQVGKYEDAVEYITKAIKFKSDAVYHGNLGMSYDMLGKEEEAVKNFNKALEINPKYEGAHLAYYNLGIYFNNNGKLTEAIQCYDKAIEINNDFFDAHWNKSLILLLLGEYNQGWKEYEYRFKKKSPSDSRVFNKPKWDGSSLEGKKILIVSEQGLGDDIQFIRYIPLVKEKGSYVIFECKKELRRLLKDFSGIDEFIEKDMVNNIDFDFYIHLMSLPRIFNTSIDNIPNKIPYLKADYEIIKKFQDKFDSKDFKIGIVWAGNPKHENDKNRSTTYEKFKSLKDIPGVKIFSLQKGAASNQLNDDLVIDLKEEIVDFADTAAIIEKLDLIISVDTSVAHLAGAMGKNIWTLISYKPDWRWLLNRNDSPWYPGMRLFRQKKPGEWEPLFNKIKIEIRNILNTR